jgi:hypothetical protein
MKCKKPRSEGIMVEKKSTPTFASRLAAALSTPGRRHKRQRHEILVAGNMIGFFRFFLKFEKAFL